MPMSLIRLETVSFAPASSPQKPRFAGGSSCAAASNTGAKVALKAFTTLAPGASSATRPASEPNLTLALSELAQFPPVFGQRGRFRVTRGVTITVVLVLVL